MTDKEIKALLKHLKIDPAGDFVLTENERPFIIQLIEEYLKRGK